LRIGPALDHLDGLVDSILQDLKTVARNDLRVTVALSLVIEFLPIIGIHFAGRKLARRFCLRPKQSWIRQGNHHFHPPFNASWVDVGRRRDAMHYVNESRCRISRIRMAWQSGAGFGVGWRAARNS